MDVRRGDASEAQQASQESAMMSHASSRHDKQQPQESGAVLTPRRRRTTPLFNPNGIGQDDEADDARGSASGAVATLPAGHVDEDNKNITDETESVDSAHRSASTRVAAQRHGEALHQPGSLSDEHRKRGRRRREDSGEYLEKQDGQLAAPQASQAPTKPQEMLSTSSPAERLWWQRNQDRIKEESSTMSSQEMQLTEGKQTPLKIDAAGAHQIQKEASANDSGPSPSVISPAAAFLSSMNDRLASPSSLSSSGMRQHQPRGYSMSPQRSDMGSSQLWDSPSRILAHSRFASHGSRQPSTSSYALGDAANHLYDVGSLAASAPNGSQVTSNLTCNEEGASFGPHGRYLLGREIGFGGFSTIREAWDMGPAGRGGTDQETADSPYPDWHRVAVKIVSNQAKDRPGEGGSPQGREEARAGELEIWEHIPSHPNLLPLLYHEQKQTEEGTLDFLVMPFCEGNLLTFVKSGGSLGAEAALDGLPRTDSTRSALLSPERQTSSAIVRPPYSDVPSSSMPSDVTGHHPRTSSGYILRPQSSIDGPSDRFVSMPLSTVLARSASLTRPSSKSPNDSDPSSHIRRASMRSRPIQSQQSRGVAIDVAKDIMCQLTQALLCLHHKASILHGDIKLENVLAQQWLTQSREPNGRSSHPASSSNDERWMDFKKETLPIDNFSPIIASICWRLADFGLAKRIDASNDDVMQQQSHAMATMGYVVQQARDAHRHEAHGSEAMSRDRSTSSNVATQNLMGGGSLAYKAPEAFFDKDTVSDEKLASPFASDMWALGCIMYALFSGRLPFQDTYEPRLQRKIAAGNWDMPHRLKRRLERGKSNIEAVSGSSPHHTSSCIASSGSHRRPDSLHMSADLRGATTPDLSSSVPSLPSRAINGDSSASMTAAPSMQSLVINDDDTCETQEQEDTISDDESNDDVSVQMDGTSRDRISVRKILRRLLEPDPSKRWTIEDVAAADWIRDGIQPPDSVAQDSAVMKSDAARSVSDGARLDVGTPEDAADNLHDVQKTSHGAGDFEDTHGDIAGPLPLDFARGQDSEDYQLRRGRSSRRTEDDITSSTKPIAIDRSQSRSRSRGAPLHREQDVPAWDFDMPATSAGFHNRRNLPSCGRRSRENGDDSGDEERGRARKGRSASADTKGRLVASARPSQDSSQNSRGSGRKSSRSVSRNRRLELEHIMPQLSIRRSASGDVQQQQQQQQQVFGEMSSESDQAMRDALTSQPRYNDSSASRSSIWKSPLRARDRLMCMISGTDASTDTQKDTK